MTRNKLFLGFLTTLIVIICVVEPVKSDEGDKKCDNGNNKAYPHIVFIMADDLGYNDVSYNDPIHQIPTPNIDALGLNGVILNRHYSTHMCTPSRAALMTGEYPIHTGMQHWVIDIDEPWGLPLDRKIMPQYFKDVGYETYMVGKWHLGFHKTEYTPLARGFDQHTGYWGPYIDYYDKTMYKLDRNYTRGLDYRKDTTMIRDTNETYATYMLSDAAVDYIEQHDRRRPMLLVVNHLAPHTGNEDDPMQAPDDEVEKYSYISTLKRRKMAAMTNIMDQGIGQIVAALKKKKMLDNSIVVFISDNGAPTIGLHSNLGSNYPLRGQKNSAWEGAVRTPAVIYSPLIKKPGRVSTEFFHITDWLPTLLAAADIKAPHSTKKLDGINQWNTISVGSAGKRREVLLNINPVVGWSGFIKDGWKLVKKPNEPVVDIWLSKASIGTAFPDDLSYVNSIHNSDVQMAIGKHLKNSNIMEILRTNEIHCDAPPNKATNPMDCDFANKQYCLFNIIRDPCEFYDVSEVYPDILIQVKNALLKYESTMVSSLYKPTDANCNPAYFNNTWVSWNDPENKRNVL